MGSVVVPVSNENSSPRGDRPVLYSGKSQVRKSTLLNIRYPAGGGDNVKTERMYNQRKRYTGTWGATNFHLRLALQATEYYPYAPDVTLVLYLAMAMGDCLGRRCGGGVSSWTISIHFRDNKTIDITDW